MKKKIALIGFIWLWYLPIIAYVSWDNSIAHLVGGTYTLYDPIDLVSPRRFDLMAKYIYAQAREWNVQCCWPLDLYREHLMVWVNFKTGAKDGNKKTFNDFLFAFHKTLDSIKQNGFDYRVSIVPIGKGLMCYYFLTKLLSPRTLYIKNIHFFLNELRNITKYVRLNIYDFCLQATKYANYTHQCYYIMHCQSILHSPPYTSRTAHFMPS